MPSKFTLERDRTAESSQGPDHVGSVVKTIRIWFADFWPGFDPDDNFIGAAIPSEMPVVLDAVNPDILFYSCFGNSHRSYDCVRVYYTGENLRPDFNLCDYGIGFDHMEFEDRYIRFPLYLSNSDAVDAVVHRRDPVDRRFIEKREFCNFIYSNGNADPVRDRFFQLMSERRKVQSLGRHLRNDDRLDRMIDSHSVAAKTRIMREFNFSIAFENSFTSGYTTEKILDAFVSRTIPIYWGNPRVGDEFNPDAFVNRHAFADDESCISHVLAIASDEERMIEMLNKPVFARGYDPLERTRALSRFLGNIMRRSPEDARRRARYGRILLYEKQTAPSQRKRIKNFLMKLKLMWK